MSGRTENSPLVLFRTHNPTGNYFSVYSHCLPIAPAPNTASAHKGIGTDPNVNHRVPKFLLSTIYPIVSHSYLYYLTCAFIINDSITETTFPISLLILHLVIAVFAHSRTRPKKASGILIISKQSNSIKERKVIFYVDDYCSDYYFYYFFKQRKQDFSYPKHQNSPAIELHSPSDRGLPYHLK